MGFLKNFRSGQTGHFGPKKAHPHNFELAQRIFFKFCTMKIAKRYMEIISMEKKSHLEKMGHFRPENGACSQVWIPSKDFLRTLAQRNGSRGTWNRYQ